MYLSKNIKWLRERENMTQTALGERVGVTRQQIAAYESDKPNGTPPFKSILKLSEIFNIPLDALAKVDIEKEGGDLNVTFRRDLNVKKDEKSTYFQKNVRLDSQSVSEPIEVVTVNQYGDPNIIQLDIHAQAGWPSNVDNKAFYEDLPAFTLPGKEWRNNSFIYIEIKGDSMHPTIYNGDWIIAKKISDYRHIREGYVHIVLTNEGINCKRVLNRVDKRGSLVLKSDNSEYPTYQEPLDNVLSLYEAVCKMSYNFVNHGETLQNQINDLSSRLTVLNDRFNRIDPS
ncbi:helix-turn-helix domain-containing protein [Reichenbachiella sp.]|uniref:helix-turn-helix domain-containing protein n=1 Tax=Reichenbachiella sp. TaxID=2184521 RepID=UPI003B5C0CFE